MTSIIVIAAFAAVVAIRFFRPQAYKLQGYLFIGTCIFVGWLLAIGSTSNEGALGNGQSNSQVLESAESELGQRPTGEQPIGARETDAENATMSTYDDANVDLDADEQPTMNATNNEM